MFSVAIPEVERLWQRFQQLGCDQNGVLSLTEPLPPHIEEDAFVRNILKSMKSQGGHVSFQSFLMALKWIECESVEKKMRATFHLLNNGDPLDRSLLAKILKRVYPEDSDATISRLADVFLREMDTSRRGYISEDEFIDWVKKMPQETITQLMDFHILPYDISHQASEQLSEFRDSKHSNSRLGPSSPSNRVIPPDKVLAQVSERICQRDWVLVGNKLGLQQKSMDEIISRFAGERQQQAYHMLLEWKRQYGELAYTSTLDKVLRSSSMTDVALLLTS
ncbi:uncharacterized protein LOC135470715 isoform X2 [Liolophura sinensis]|uniref:uncharacterized protein LOC135470715 isoform X2 n=1 Tax=Liolophura sinensis TaxID=3198878 RepID=UPI003159011B